MHRTRTLALLIGLLALLAATASGADISGKWAGNLQTPDGGNYALTLTLKVDGDKVTGTMTGPNGDMSIEDGKLDGESVQWVLNVDAGGQQLSFKCSGKLTGADELNVKMAGGGEMNFEFTAKRTAS